MEFKSLLPILIFRNKLEIFKFKAQTNKNLRFTSKQLKYSEPLDNLEKFFLLNLISSVLSIASERFDNVTLRFGYINYYMRLQYIFIVLEKINSKNNN